MSESGVDVVATIRIKNDQLRGDAEKTKQEFRGIKTEAEKPTALVIDTKAAQQQVQTLDAQINKLRAQRIGPSALGQKEVVEKIDAQIATLKTSLATARTEAAKPIPVKIDTTNANKVLDDLRAKIAAVGAPGGGGGVPAPDSGGGVGRAVLNQVKGQFGLPGTGGSKDDAAAKAAAKSVEAAAKAFIAVGAAMAFVEAGVKSLDIVYGKLNGDQEQVTKGVNGVLDALRGIPIVGGPAVAIGTALNEVFTGDLAYQKKTLAEAAAIDKKSESLKRQADEVAKLADELRGMIAEEDKRTVAESRESFTPGQKRVAETSDQLRDLDAKRTAAEAKGQNVAEFDDARKRIVDRLNREIEESQRDHEKRMSDIGIQGQADRLRAAGQTRAAERVELDKRLQDQIDAEKDGAAAVELERQKGERLQGFDAETQRKKEAAAAKDFETQSKAANAITEKIGEEAHKQAAVQIKAREAAAKELAKSEERAGELRSQAREADLRTAGEGYKADVEKFTRAADEKIKKATSADERSAAVGAKASGLRALASDHARDLLKFRSPEELANKLQSDISVRAMLGPVIPTSVATAARTNLGSGVGASGGPNAEGNATEKKQLTALDEIKKNTDPNKAQRIRILK